MFGKIIQLACICLIVLIFSLFPFHLAHADGGIVTPDSEIWALIEEGQQIAVIQINEDNTAEVDLFITMLDRSNLSHEVTFFIPLGTEASGFHVVEQTSLEFDKALTEQLDKQIKEYGEREASYQASVQSSLLLGTIMTNGLWSWAIVIPAFLSGCAPQAPVPVATFQTESSSISIYQMDEQMDLAALIETSGLDPSVKGTLEDLTGQQIAVVDLKTQPKGEENEWLSQSETNGQPGIHLTWTSTLVSHSVEASYTYPLGTGRAWASPIELTRIYVVAPEGIDFSVESPKLGADLSGLEGNSWSGLAGRIYWKIDQAKSPAFAVDNSYGEYGHIWRGTFVKSNSDRDIVVMKLPEITTETQSAIRISRIHRIVNRMTWIISLLVGAIIWVAAWWFIMTRMLKAPYHWRDGKMWSDAFAWSIIYPGITVLTLVLAGLVGLGLIMLLLSFPETPEFVSRIFDSQIGSSAMIFLIGLPVWVTITGLINAFFFSMLRASKMNVTRLRAFISYLLVILVANGIYFGFAFAYGKIAGAF
jgi:hypothetical protein